MYTLVAHQLSNTGSPITTSAIDTTGADLLIAFGTYPLSNTPSDSKGGTWTPLTAQSGYGRLFWCKPTSVGTGHTFSLTDSGGTALAIQAWSGSAASPFDQQNGFVGNAPTSVWKPGAVVPTENNELIVCGAGLGSGIGGAGTLSIDSGFTISDQVPYGVSYYCGFAYLVQTTAGSVNPEWTTYNSGFGDLAIATFKAQASLVTFVGQRGSQRPFPFKPGGRR